MKDSEIFDNYEAYVKGLSTSDLESICRDIDMASYPDRHKIVSDEIKERLSKEGPDYTPQLHKKDGKKAKNPCQHRIDGILEILTRNKPTVDFKDWVYCMPSFLP